MSWKFPRRATLHFPNVAPSRYLKERGKYATGEGRAAYAVGEGRTARSAKLANFAIFCKFLEGSFSVVSKRNFARKYAFESSRRDLHNALLITALKSHFF